VTAGLPAPLGLPGQVPMNPEERLRAPAVTRPEECVMAPPVLASQGSPVLLGRHRECAALDASLAALRWAPEQDLLQAECYFAQAASPLTWSQRSRPSQSRPRLALCADSAADLRTGLRRQATSTNVRSMSGTTMGLR